MGFHLRVCQARAFSFSWQFAQLLLTHALSLALSVSPRSSCVDGLKYSSLGVDVSSSCRLREKRPTFFSTNPECTTTSPGFIFDCQ